MSGAVGYHQARAMLLELLQQQDEVSDIKIVGLEHMSDHDKTFLLVTCSATIIEHAICAIAQYDSESARKGFEALTTSMAKRIERICT